MEGGMRKEGRWREQGGEERRGMRQRGREIKNSKDGGK